MVELGYALSSEEHSAQGLVEHARRAEEAGFTFALISDHFHPWISQQGNSPFVWSVIGGIAQVTKQLRLGTGVTCPIIRYHPAIIAQAAATCAEMMPGRFFLGLGTGESLNEHVLGDHWPPIDVRQDMLEEAVQVIRDLWTGEEINFWGNYYTVEEARLFTLPKQLPPIYIAAAGPDSAQIAGEIGDGLISTIPDPKVVKAFQTSGGQNKPRIGQITVAWAKSDVEALELVHTWWPEAVLPGQLSVDLRTPKHFEAAVKLVKKEDMASVMPLGPDPKRHIDEIQKMVDAGFDMVYIHQVGPDQEGFFNFYQKEIQPHFR